MPSQSENILNGSYLANNEFTTINLGGRDENNKNQLENGLEMMFLSVVLCILFTNWHQNCDNHYHCNYCSIHFYSVNNTSLLDCHNASSTVHKAHITGANSVSQCYLFICFIISFIGHIII